MEHIHAFMTGTRLDFIDNQHDSHFVGKTHGPDGWTETPWHPVRDGGVRL